MKKCETFSEKLHAMNACQDAIDWVKQIDYTLSEAWEHCDRGDWMLWYAAKVGVPIRPLTLAKAKCVQLVEHLMQYQRSIQAVHTAIGFGHGEVTRKELNRAAAAAYDAAYAAANAAYDAAYDAAYAAATAAAGAATATYATYATYAAAADAADAASAAAERRNVLRQCADICRDVLTQYVIEEQS